MPSPEPRLAVCPGTYDPVTNGHLDVITRASRLFDELIVAVVNASVRKSKALFTTEQRMGFIEEATKHLTALAEKLWGAEKPRMKSLKRLATKKPQLSAVFFTPEGAHIGGLIVDPLTGAIIKFGRSPEK